MTMQLDRAVTGILDAALAGQPLTREDALTLLRRVGAHSVEMGLLCGVADHLSRQRFGGLGEVFAQVGVNCKHCPVECGFCVLAGVDDDLDLELEPDEVVQRALAFVTDGANAVSLMVTADYSFERFLELGRMVRTHLPSDFPLVANVGDFDGRGATELRSAGFTAIYHVIRLGEGEVTPITVATRARTLAAAREVGLDVSYCLEPIGPEHTAEELVEGIFRGAEFTPTSMATMRRVDVPGSPMAGSGQITEREQQRIQAVTSLVALSWPGLLVLSAHEPSPLFLHAGANRLSAETGVNPRDTERDTTRHRGRSVADLQKMLVEAGYRLRQGASPALQGPLREVAVPPAR